MGRIQKKKGPLSGIPITPVAGIQDKSIAGKSSYKGMAFPGGPGSNRPNFKRSPAGIFSDDQFKIKPYFPDPVRAQRRILTERAKKRLKYKPDHRSSGSSRDLSGSSIKTIEGKQKLGI